MDALKRSLASEKQAAPAAAKGQERAKGKKPKKAAAGQREMLLPISGGGKRAAKETAKETVKEAPKKAEKPVCAPVRSAAPGYIPAVPPRAPAMWIVAAIRAAIAATASGQKLLHRAGRSPLFQRRIHRGEAAVQRGADAVDGDDDHDADAGRDQAIFDGGGTGLVTQKF
jgi:hypothetical protein